MSKSTRPTRSNHRARRIATLAFVLGGGFLFLLVVLLGALRLAAVRGYVVTQVNKVLEGEFSGNLTIEHAERIGLTGVEGVNATMFDPNGRAVLIVRGASAHLSIVPLVWAILVHPHDSLPIDIRKVTADHVEVRLIDDGLIEELGGKPTPAIGFATGIERIILNLKQQQVPIPLPPKPLVFVAYLGDTAKEEAVKLAGELRRRFSGVILAMGSKSLKAQLRQANTSGVRYTIVIGDEEVKSAAVQLRDMETSQQRIVPLGQMADALK